MTVLSGAAAVPRSDPPPAGSPLLPPAPELTARAREVQAHPEDAWRGEPEQRKRAYAARHGVDVDAVHDVAELDKALEVGIGTPDFLPGRWLRCGTAAADTVGRVRTASSLGTGFLVSPWLLLTNNHVLPSAEDAAGSTVTFRYEDDETEQRSGSVRHALEPERCFVTSVVADLDFTLVAVAASAGGAPPGAAFGWLPAKGATGKILEGLPVNIVQHPNGRPREVAVRNNVLLSVDDPTRLTYGTDTEPGSSGSPVLNDEWELVALHHSGGGQAPGRAVGNSGIRISAIVARVTEVAAEVAGAGAAGGGAGAGGVAGQAGVEAGALLEEFLRTGRAP